MTDEGLLAQLPADQHATNGIPDPAVAADRERAAQLAAVRLSPFLCPGGLRTSPLGAGWSSDIDAHVRNRPPAELLRAAGWLPLDGLLARLGTPDEGRWAIVESGRVLGALDLHTAPPPDPVDAVLGRCRRRGAVRLREVLELRALLAAGHRMPEVDQVLTIAADAEATMGGEALRAWTSGCARSLPAPVPRKAVQQTLQRFRRRFGRRRVVVALSGVDGSGKSTLAQLLVTSLDAAGVPASPVWVRPGMGLEWLEGLTKALKRLLGQDPQPAVAVVAAGAGHTPRSRRGLVGWAWSLVVVAAYLLATARQHGRSQGVAVYDRHLPDAMVTLDFVYSGVSLRLQKLLVRLLLPRPDLACYLDISADRAIRRKADPLFGRYAVERQLELYQQQLANHRLVRLGSESTPEGLAMQVLELLTADPAGTKRKKLL